MSLTTALTDICFHTGKTRQRSSGKQKTEKTKSIHTRNFIGWYAGLPIS